MKTSACKTYLAIAATALLMGACGGDVDDAAPETPASTSAPADADPTTSLDPETEPAADVDTEPDDADSAIPTGEWRYPSDAISEIEIVSAPTGVTGRPTISWSPIPDAVSYELTIVDSNGRPYWIGQTSDTEIPVGGEPLLEEASAGARLAPGMRWFVIARNEAGSPLAQSEIAEVQ